MGLPPRLQERGFNLLSYFTRHATAANLLLAILLVAGIAASTRIRAQFFPDVVIESVSVSVAWEGAGPEEVDAGVIAVIEPALLAVEGVTEARSTSTEGSGRVSLDFEPGWDMGRATEDVTAAVDAVSNLPENAEDPVVRRANWRDRVTDVVISGPVSVEQLGRFADEFSTLLFADGISRVSINGIAAPAVEVDVPQRNLIRHDVTLSDIAGVISEAANTNPAGEVGAGGARLRTGTERRDAEDLNDLVVRANADGSKLLLGDLADIRVIGADNGRAYYRGGNPAVSLRVDRSDRGDAIALQAAVEAAAEEFQTTLPRGVTIELTRTRAEAITDRIALLIDNGLMGLALVVGLLFLFLSARTAFWVAAGIPVAMAAAIGLMYLSGLTLNMISLFALIICLGIVVDDAIVVGEHADFRARRLGEPPVLAAENAAKRMAAPVFSATITTVLAFFGLVSIGGRFGSLIADIPFTVIVVLLASLVECFLILPNHMAHAIAARGKDRWYDWPSRVTNAGFRWVRTKAFAPLMAWVIRLRYPVMALAILILANAVGLFLKGDVTWRFFNAPEQGSITGNIAMLPTATRADTRAMTEELQRATDAVAARYAAEHGTDPVLFSMTQVGGTGGRGLSGSDTKDPDQLGSIEIELIDADQRPYSSFAFLADLQDEVVNHPMLETLSFRGWRSGPGGDALDVKLFGADSRTLKAAAEALKVELGQYTVVSALEDSLAYDKTELVLDLTPLGRALGFTVEGLGRELRQRLNGIEAAEFPVGTRTGTITVGLPGEEIAADFLTTARMRTPDGQYVPLNEIVTVDSQYGFSSVQRENGVNLITVTGDISEDDPVAAEAVTTALRADILPDIAARFGVGWDLGGLVEQESDFLTDALIGFTLCVLGIYLTLAWIFASWTRPLVVLAIVPFGLIGTIWGHYSWDVPLSIFTVVGLIGMTGIIINDSIVLVTTIDEYAEKRGLVPAVIDAATDRLRPILLTTLTTVLGLTPLLYESSAQAQFLKPTVITLAYGLGFGFLMVLLVVPALVIMQQDVGQLFRSLRRGVAGRHDRRAIRLVLSGAGLTIAALALATVGRWALTGAALPGLAALVPALAALPAGLAAFAGLMAGTLLILVATGAALWLVSRRRTAA
ncbi:efflux RND transporter permease subunit [Oceanomicrobium pacificus]|uniref:AcrB/AcrD/AcrF family protein n=1 Tax=Oceanomicrobium pacificus TaxID=2692916 RepID=A0A6B0U056_9RHOB|nr:efflux RND transporter permease subunit [Oceanomicrobium pacificus]MXU66614.1 AcrB/AcrD/AcrF family protein [Oceanomicrobium pacificus]